MLLLHCDRRNLSCLIKLGNKSAHSKIYKHQTLRLPYTSHSCVPGTPSSSDWMVCPVGKHNVIDKKKYLLIIVLELCSSLSIYTLPLHLLSSFVFQLTVKKIVNINKLMYVFGLQISHAWIYKKKDPICNKSPLLLECITSSLAVTVFFPKTNISRQITSWTYCLAASVGEEKVCYRKLWSA